MGRVVIDSNMVQGFLFQIKIQKKEQIGFISVGRHYDDA